MIFGYLKVETETFTAKT